MDYYGWNDGTSLYHHGILGQKWGKRNGPPYPLDADDHSASEKKAGWRKSLGASASERKAHRLAKKQEKRAKKQAQIDSISRFYQQRMRMSKAAADIQAKNVINLEKTAAALLTAGVLAGGAVAVYAAVKKNPNDEYSGDFIINKGADVFRVQGNTHEDLPEGFFYATPDKNDARLYRGGWGEEKGLFGLPTGEYKKALQIGANKDINIAGMPTAKKLFNELQKDPAFRKASEDYYYSVEQFLTDAPLDKANEAPFIMFQQRLMAEGYGGVIDYNDKFGQGYRAKAPVILFNDNSPKNTKLSRAGNIVDTFAIKKIEQLDADKIRADKEYFNQHVMKILGQQAITDNTWEIAGGLIGAGAGALASIGFVEAVKSEARKNDKKNAKKKKR